MASPAKIEQVLPDTLPEDFGDWDRADSPAAPPARSGGFEAAPDFVAVPKPPAQPAKPQGPAARRVSVLSSAATPIRPNGAVVNGMRNTTALKAAAMREADEVLFQSVRANRANAEVQARSGSRWMMAAALPLCLIVVMLALTALYYRGWLPMSRHSVDATPVAADTQPDTNALRPSPSLPSTSDRQPAATNAQQTTDPRPATNLKEVVPPQVQAKMMHDQLTAPTRIPQNLKLKAEEEAPSSLSIGAANMGSPGGNGAIGAIFNEQPHSNVNVEAPKTVIVSAGVAGGLLIQKTPPVYPEIAKKARVTGTVVLKATISKTGTIEKLYVVSGPSMLTQAAFDAVRTWRYKPYKLNNEPVDIETTVNVIFSLGS